MAVIRPFRALRPPTERAQEVASVPYDVVNTDEARALANGNPLSFLHVSRPEIDLPDGTDIYSDAVYRKAVENFEKLIATCPLEKEAEPSLYIYRLIMGDHQQIGIVACCSIDEYDNDTIRKHERTRRDKEDDRTRHMIMLRAQTGPVFLTYRKRPDIDEQVLAAMNASPLYDITAADGVRHTIWRLAETDNLVNSFTAVPLLYIADGHHRAASASRARAELREQSFTHTGREDYNYFLTVIFPDSQVRILAYNRIVRDLNGLSKEEFLEAIRRQFTVAENASPRPRNAVSGACILTENGMGSSSRLIQRNRLVSSRVSTSAFSRTGCSIRCWASKTFAPTSVSTSSAACAALKNSNVLLTKAKPPLRFRFIRRRSTSF